MGLVIMKPMGYDSSTHALGPVATFESSFTSAQNIAGYVKADNSNTADVGFPTTPSDSDWAGTSASPYGYGLFTAIISGIGSNSSPSISDLNNHPLVTEYWHSSHSNSLNGTNLQADSSDLTWDWSGLTISITGADTISMSTYNINYTAGYPAVTDGIRTISNDRGNVYLNGILYASQSGGGSGNEYFTDDTFGTTFQYNSPKTFDAGDFDTKVQGTFGGSSFVNHGRSIDISNISNTDSEKITALLKAIDIQTYRTFKKEL